MGEEPNTGKKLDLEVDREAAEKAAKELEEQPAKDEDEEDWNF
jgi:hypothetical protein